MEQNLSREQQEQDTDFGPISFVHSTRLFYVSFNLRPRLVSTTSFSYSSSTSPNHLIPPKNLPLFFIFQVGCCVSLHLLGGAGHKTTLFPSNSCW